MMPRTIQHNNELSFTASHTNNYNHNKNNNTQNPHSNTSNTTFEYGLDVSVPVVTTVNALPTEFNQLGEAVLPQAPSISLIATKPDNDKANVVNSKKSTRSFVPQQFFHYQRTRDNVEQIISKIGYDACLPLFVHEENNCLFLQVGIIGFENYPKDKITKVRPKIVYGRRWYIEPYMPTSEVIQTAFIALQKAREHELREYFYMQVAVDGRIHRTTPFNTHMDLPLMAKNPLHFIKNSDQINGYLTNGYLTNVNDLNTANNLTDANLANKNSIADLGKSQSKTQDKTLKQHIEHQLAYLQFAGLAFQLTRFETLDELIILSVRLTEQTNNTDEVNRIVKQHFPEQLNSTHHLLIDRSKLGTDIATTNHTNDNQRIMDAIIYRLFDAMVQTSYQHISRNFTYKGFARFDQSISPKKLAQFSAKTRIIAKKDKTPTFTQAFKQMVATVDSAKAPMYAKNIELYRQQKQAVNRHENLDGYLPYVDKQQPNQTAVHPVNPYHFHQKVYQNTTHSRTTQPANEEHTSEIIAMAWCDKTSFDDIKFQTGLSEQEVIRLMRTNLKRASFKVWRKRVTGRFAKHRQLDTSKNRSSNHTNKVRKPKGQSTKTISARAGYKRLSYS